MLIVAVIGHAILLVRCQAAACHYGHVCHDRDMPPVPQAQKYAAIIAVSALHDWYSAMRRKKEIHYLLPARLKFGIFMAPFHPLGEDSTLALERDLELLQWLDYLGFDEAWIGEHHSAGWETIASPESLHSRGGAAYRRSSSLVLVLLASRTTIH